VLDRSEGEAWVTLVPGWQVSGGERWGDEIKIVKLKVH
jgi:hypothetical protein